MDMRYFVASGSVSQWRDNVSVFDYDPTRGLSNHQTWISNDAGSCNITLLELCTSTRLNVGIQHCRSDMLVRNQRLNTQIRTSSGSITHKCPRADRSRYNKMVLTVFYWLYSRRIVLEYSSNDTVSHHPNPVDRQLSRGRNRTLQSTVYSNFELCLTCGYRKRSGQWISTESTIALM